MKWKIRERRNTIIISMLTLCMLALIIAGLHQRSAASIPASEQSSHSPSPSGKPSPSAPARTQAQSAGADDLFQLINHEQYRYFRVSEQNQHWDYKPGQSIWYSRVDATFILSLNVPGSPAVSARQIDLLRSNIAVTTMSGEPVSFTASEGSGDQQLVISLKGSNASDLTITFFSADQSQSKPLNVYYMKPFDYKITAERLPYSDRAFALSAQSVEMPLPVRIGGENELVFQFTDEVDRASVDELFAKTLKDAAWKIEWIDNRTFKLTAAFGSPGKDGLVYLTADGIRNARGVDLKTNRGLWLMPNALQNYVLYDPTNGKQSVLAMPDRPYRSASVAPDEEWTLAGIGVKMPLAEETMYELLDRKGKVAHTLQAGEAFSPEWMPGGSGIVYIDGKSGKRALSLLSLDNFEKEAVWQVPNAKGRIVAFDVDPATGRIAIAWGLFNEEQDGLMDIQVEVLKGLKDATPLTFHNVGAFRCMDGPCLSSIDFMNDGYLVVGDDSGFTALEISTGKTRQIAVQPANAKRSAQTVLPYRSRTWNVHMTESGGKEKWSWSDGEQDIVFTTSIGIPDNAAVIRGPYGSGQTALFYVEQKGWFRIDPVAKTAKPANDVPVSLNPIWVVGTHKSKLIAGTNGN